MGRKRWIVAVFVLALATVAIIAVWARLLVPEESAVRLRASSQLRGVMQACVVYGQEHGGRWPDAADWQKTLVDAKLLSPEVLEHPRARPGVEPWIAVYQLAPDAGRSRSTNNFEETRPVFIENPALWDGEGANVAYNDNHVQWEDGQSVKRMLEELRAGTWKPRVVKDEFSRPEGAPK